MRDWTPATDKIVALRRQGTALFSFVAVWAAISAFVWLVGEASQATFLGLPLSAYVMGQGAIMALVLVGVRLADNGDRR
jgi:putative solute:sodium symporter small subunit